MTDGPYQFPPEPEAQASAVFLAAIGNVCLQWALLELVVLGILYVIKDVDDTEGDLLFGHLDMLPRIKMAIALLDHHRAPGDLVRRLQAMRDQIGDKGKVAARRNQAVHGAHADTEQLGTYLMRMPRWRGPKKVEAVSIGDMATLAAEIHDLRREASAVMEAIGFWKFGDAG